MKVFLSYSHKDKEIVRKIADDLQREGVSVWFDENVIKPGESWAEKLSEAVAKADAVIVVISRNTAASQWQTSEIAFAISAQRQDASKRVIPVVIDKGVDLPFFLKTVLYCDLSDDSAYKRNFPQLIQALQYSNATSSPVQNIDRFRIDSLKAERYMLAKEMEIQVRKKIIWSTSILGALASVITASFALFVGYLGNIVWDHGTVNFVVGALAGVISSIIAIFAVRLLHKRATRSESNHAK